LSWVNWAVETAVFPKCARHPARRTLKGEHHVQRKRSRNRNRHDLAGNAYAQTATPNLDKRQANQEKRIEQGVKSGELTKKEAAAWKNAKRSWKPTSKKPKPTAW
jgi:hypothetical protein